MTVASGLSIVVPVKDRVPETRALFASLRVAMSACPEPTELLLVDDSAASVAREHRRTCAAYEARYLTGPRNVGAKRNVGVRHATYDLIMFIDSDCRATPDLLSRHVKTLRSAGEDVAAVAGPTFVHGADSAVSRVMARSKLLNSAFEWPKTCRTVAWATTCNLAVRRAAFEAVGGFAEHPLTVVGGEDVDLGIRLTEAGYTIVCDAEAVVLHDKGSSDSLATVARRLVTYGRSGQWLLQVHPSRGRFKANRASLLAATTVLVAATARKSHGRSALLLPLLAAALLARDSHARLAAGERGARAIGEATACATLDWAFDLGELIAAIQVRRPDRAFTGFAWTDDPAFRWDGTPDAPYGR